jgi:hypothetical protein
MATRQPWLTRLDALLRRLGLPVRALATREHSLLLWLERAGSDDFVVTVHPRASGRPGFATTGKYVVAYQGSDLDERSRVWLGTLAALLRKVEAHLPATFEVADGIFGDSVPPEDKFLRLFPFCAVERSWVAAEPVVEVLVRTTTRCNQQCPFCSAPEHDIPSPAAVCDAIALAAELFPKATLSLTGGEPTLRGSFPEELDAALSLSALQQVQVQTNAVSFAGKLDPARWPASPRLMFFVSLHATDPGIYDRCSGTAGQLPLALQGIRRLLQAGHPVTLNCVVQAANLAHLPSYLRSLPALLPLGEQLELHFSSLICHDRRPGASDFLVRYTELAAALQSAVPLAQALGLRVQSLLSSTHASLPACLLAPSARGHAPHTAVLRGDETGFEHHNRPWVKAADCSRCRWFDSCLGVPRAYARKFGLAELRPVLEA